MTAMMKAVAIAAYDGLSGVEILEFPKPTPAAGEVLVRVHACAVNPLDWKVTDGSVASFLDREPPFIIGADISGVVEEVGQGVARHKVGDKVFGQVGLLGGYAQYVVTAEGRLSAKPAGLSFEEAACIAISGATAYDLVIRDGGLKKGERVLVQGGAGGVGHMAVQIAHDAGAYVIATASPANADFLRDLGADEVIDYRAKPFEEAVSDVDLVVDTVGGDVLARSWAVLTPVGRMTTSVPPTQSLAHGDREARFSIGKPDADGANLDLLGDMAAQGRVRPRLQQVFPFERVADALALSMAGHVRGKLALTLQEG